MKTLKDIVIKAFIEGSDNFGETPTGEISNLEYLTLGKQYHVCIQLNDGSSAGVGLVKNGNQYDVISGHKVFSVDSTPELENELKTAIISDF